MASTPQRRFLISDLLVLVAASALGLFLAREFDLLRPQGVTIPHEMSSEAWARLVTLASSLAWALSLGVLALRIRPPRPGWRRVGRQPGFAACLAVAVTAVFQCFFGAPHLLATAGNSVRWELQAFLFLMRIVLPYDTTIAIVSVWLVLAVGGVWRAEPSWVDRAGRVLGGYFIAAAVVLQVLTWFAG
jgi:hypothetical protein